jgi:hypothetical protein
MTKLGNAGQLHLVLPIFPANDQGRQPDFSLCCEKAKS